MTVSSTTRKAGPFFGNDVTTSFSFTFKLFDEGDLQLTLVDADDAETVLTLDSDYSVSLNADQDDNPGGSITYPLSGDPLATGETLAGVDITAATQATDLTNLGRFLPQVIEAALDRGVILIQQLKERLARTISIPVGESTDVVLPRAELRANTVMAFDEDGNVTVSADLGALLQQAIDAAAQAEAIVESIVAGGAMQRESFDWSGSFTITVGTVTTLSMAFVDNLFMEPTNFTVVGQVITPTFTTFGAQRVTFYFV